MPQRILVVEDEPSVADLIEAVLTPESDDLLMVARRVEALTAFVTDQEGINLLAGTKRATARPRRVIVTCSPLLSTSASSSDKRVLAS